MILIFPWWRLRNSSNLASHFSTRINLSRKQISNLSRSRRPTSTVLSSFGLTKLEWHRYVYKWLITPFPMDSLHYNQTLIHLIYELFSIFLNPRIIKFGEIHSIEVPHSSIPIDLSKRIKSSSKIYISHFFGQRVGRNMKSLRSLLLHILVDVPSSMSSSKVPYTEKHQID